MTLSNGLHKLSIATFGITQLKHELKLELKHENWSGYGSLKKENF